MKKPLALLLLSLSAGVAYPGVIHVPANQPTIQAGIDAAVEHFDTVVVADGIYTGDGNRDLDFGGKAIVVQSQNGPEATIIDCQGDSANDHRGFHFHSGEDYTTVVQGFTIRNGYMYIDDTTVTYGGGIWCESSSPTIADCVIEDCWAKMGGGIACRESSPRFVDCVVRANYAYLWGGGMQCALSSPVLTGCLFEADTSRHSGGAMYVQDNSFPDVTDCRFEANFSWGGNGGIYCILECSPTLANCVFSRNSGHNSYALTLYRSCSPSLTNCTFFEGGVYCGRSSSPALDNCIIAFSPEQAVKCYYYAGEPCYPTLTCCDVYGNAGGDWVDCIAGQDNSNNNVSADPLFCDTAASDFHVDELSPCAPALSGCGQLIGALDVGCGSPARVWYVLPDSSGDAPTIQAAIDSCSSLDTVLVGPGTYTGAGNRDIELRGKSIILTSAAGPQQTIVDCAGSPGDEHRAFYAHEGEDSTTLIEGLSIIDGYQETGTGGGMLFDGSSPTVRNCLFFGNHAYSGGAVGCDQLVAYLRFEDCSFDSNTAGNNGGAIATNSGISLSNCLLNHNSALSDGGAIYLYNNDTTMYSSDSSHATFCVFSGNQAGNSGGALYAVNASPLAANCTFYGHSSATGGTISVGSYSFLLLARCLVAFNEGPQAVACLAPTSYPYVFCSDIYGNPGGDWVGCIADQYGVNGNFTADPWFCDTAAGDLHLFANSPCAPDNNPCDSLVGALGVGCSGMRSTIEPDLMELPLEGARYSETATVRIGEFDDGYAAADVDPSTVLVNGTVAPTSWEVLPSHPDFEGEVFQITFPIADFLLTYGILLDTTVQIHDVSGQYTDQTAFSVAGTVTIIGHGRGDLNDDGTVNIVDLTYLAAYLFAGGPPPVIEETGDVNHDGDINIVDLTQMVAYLFGEE